MRGSCWGLRQPPPVNRTSSAPLATVEYFDIARYEGRWHEAARLPHNFEKGCVAATATYARRDDGLVGVRNVCTKADGKSSSIDGRPHFSF